MKSQNIVMFLCVLGMAAQPLLGRAIQQESSKKELPVKIFLAGDSTVCDYAIDSAYKVKRAGWGRYLQGYFDGSKAAVFNYARSGRSSKSFTEEPEYRRIWNEIGTGDYLFIQFGHNDEKLEDPARGTDATLPAESEGSFKWYLNEKYIKPALQKGAQPVLVTPVSRRDADGNVSDTHQSYDDAIRELASEAGVPLIDLTQKTTELYAGLFAGQGADGTAALFAVRNNGDIDNTHFNGKGAREVCALVIEGVQALQLPLADLITPAGAASSAASAAGGGQALIALNAAESLVGKLAPAYQLSGFGSNGESWLLFPHKLDLLNDTVTITVKIRFNTLDGHNGIGFISMDGAGRKGYMMLTGQNVKNVGTSGGAGGQSMNAASGSFIWETGKNYIFKSEIAGGIINHYVYGEDMTPLAIKTDTDINRGHSNTDIVYAAIGGTDTAQAIWSDIKITLNGTEHVIDTVLEQKTLPYLSVSQKMLRIRKDESAKIQFRSIAAGGANAGILAFSDSPEILRIEQTEADALTVKGLASGLVTLRITNAADASLKEAITVSVLDFPQAVDYGALTAYPATGASDAYTDGDLCLTFDDAPELVTGGTIWIYNADNSAADTGEPVDIIAFNGERQQVLGAIDNDIFVGDQLVRIEGNNVFITPHFDKLEYGKQYYIAIPRDSIKGSINGSAFEGFSDHAADALWTFSTRTAPALNVTQPVTVDGSSDSAADFRTIYGAMKALAKESGSWTINVAPGVYRELVHYDGTADITIIGQGSAQYGRDVVIQYTNCNQMNGGTNTRPSFYFSGANLTLKNICLINTSERGISYTGGPVPSDTQAETLNFSSANHNLTAINCAFISRQDTLQTSGRNWFYQCYIEGDTDFIWGTADVCLIEDCDILSVDDPKRSSQESYLLVSRSGNARSDTVPKGYVVLNSRITVQDGMTLFFGRNAGGSGFYDQCAVIGCRLTLEGNSRLDPAIWKASPYICIPGAAEHVGWKVYGNTVNGQPQNTAEKFANTVELPQALYESEYQSRAEILNRVYHKDGSYRDAAYSWNPELP